MNKQARIFVAGHRGMVGSAIVRRLQSAGFSNLILRTSRELDLRDQQAVETFFQAEKPECLFVVFQGKLVFDTTKPDGTPRKLADATRIHALGWQHRIGLEEGIAAAYRWFQENHLQAASRG